MRGQRCTDARIVGNDFVASIDKALVPDCLEQRPDALDVTVVQRVIGFVEIHPQAHALGHLLPVTDVAHDGFATTARKFLDADFFLDFTLVEDAEFFFDFMLHRQAVGVPARFARHIEAPHGLVTRKGVFEAAREHMMNSGLAVGRRRAFVEAEVRPAD